MTSGPSEAAAYDEKAFRVVGLYHSELRTMVAMASASLGVFAFRSNFEDRTARLTAIVGSAVLAALCIWFGINAEREYNFNIKGLLSGSHPEVLRSVNRWRGTPYIVSGAIGAAYSAAVVRLIFFRKQGN